MHAAASDNTGSFCTFAAPNIPPKASHRWKNCFSPYLHRDRNAIERRFGRIKEYRRIATRYDRLERNCLVAILC